MLRDVFYYGQKPNVHPREKPAKNLEDARLQSTTEHFWIVNEYCDYTNFDWDFDFDFLPDEDVWAQGHNNVWPSQHQKDSGTWLCPKIHSDKIVYRTDVDFVKRINIKTENWVELEKIDQSSFDFSWHPDPTDPPYIYAWGCRYYPVTHSPVLEYRVQGATEYKYMDSFIELLPDMTNYKILHDIEDDTFDFRWRPDIKNPPYIYVWGNQHHNAKIMPTIEYHVSGATERHYMDDSWHCKLKQKPENFEVFEKIKDFDYSWVTDPSSPPYIYVWGNQWNKPQDKASVIYRVEKATEYKYMENHVIREPCMDSWEIPENIDSSDFDFSWEPSPADNPYIYQFGTQWQKDGGPRYLTTGATEIKYVDVQKVKALPTFENWIIPANIDVTRFDFSWHPDQMSPPYDYIFSTQWALTGGPIYTVPGATEKKYIEEPSAMALPDRSNWHIPEDIDVDSFDFSWHPFAEDDPCVYQIGTQHQKTGGPVYVTPGTDEHSPIKYIDRRILKSIKKQNKEKFTILNDYKIKEFDWSWHPDETEEPYIYVFGNKQYPPEIMPTIEYRVEGATQIKYIHDIVATLDNDFTNWLIPDYIDKDSFDFSWKPDPNDPPYIYEFPTQWNNRGGPKYVISGATEYKYMDNPTANIVTDKYRWNIPDNIDDTGFDYSWMPHPDDPPFIYQFGTQWQKTGGPKYIVRGAKEFKYVDIQKVKALVIADNKNWVIPTNLDISEFDFSWHPDDTNPAYIYQFGTQWAMSGGPKYIVEGAKETRYEDNPVAKAAVNMDNWEIPDDIEKESFDFSWHPYAEDQPFIYQFGTQHQKTGGPRYITPGSDEMSPIKYIDTRILKATKLPRKENFEIADGVKVKDFDFSWHPDDTEQPYIYVFGNDKYPAEIMPTLRYVVVGATQIKYVKNKIATLDQNKDNWIIPKNIDEESFDFTWVPDPTSPPYIYEFATVWNDRGGPIYTVPEATEKKYIENIKAKTLPDKKYWKVLIAIEEDKFDFSWVPHPEAPPYIYVFGNQWNYATIEPTVEYHVPGATEKKYMTETVAYVLPEPDKFEVLFDIHDFDFSWRPNPKDPPYIYVFGNTQYGAVKMPTVKYTLKGATEIKYIDTLTAKLAPNYDKYVELIPCDKTTFDFSWVPDPDDPPYIYVWGNQWNDAITEPTLEYRVPEASQRKYMSQIINVLPNYDNWKTIIPVENTFDFTWRPNPNDPPYIYIFGNQWNKAEVEPTLMYTVKKSSSKKYVENIVAQVSPDMSKWIIDKGIDVKDFDFSWRPDPGSPPYIYQFGTLQDDNDGPRYITPNNNGEIVRLPRVEKKTKSEIDIVPTYTITTTLEDLIEDHTDELFWAIRKSINYSNFDFNWRPNIEQARYVQVFGSPESVETQTYFVSAKMYKQGYTNFNFVTAEAKVEDEYLAELFEKPDMFFIDRGNRFSKNRYEQLKQRFPNIQKARYHNGWVDTIYRCLNKCKTQLAWILNSELDYSDFDFKYYPNPWQMKMVHIFGTQWSHWGATYMVNKDTFFQDTKYIKTIEHLSNINFVKNRKAKAIDCLYDVYLIDHGNDNIEMIKTQLENKICNNVKIVSYNESYLKTFKNILKGLETKKEHYIWICSTVCDYKNFDFSYICDPFAKENLHVFPSDKQKFGDTFLVNVNRLRSLLDDLEHLEDFEKVNYNQHLQAKRLQPPVFIVNEDTHYSSYNLEHNFPYALFITKDNENISFSYNEPMPLWHTKNIEILSTGGSVLAIPKQASEHVSDELYDYPNIIKAKNLIKSNPLDIVYLSNGEKTADENYEHLLKITKGLPNRIVRVDGINGRVAAYHAAVNSSQTPWVFTIFAKLRIDENFDWSWQPDRLQIPKHYVFTAKNPVNGLVYGHQAMIAYNKKLALQNKGKGLDFTLDDPHSVLDIFSGIAMFNTDEYSTWRTAFREVIKLKSDYTDVSQERLNIWMSKAEGNFAENCLQGAKDAVEFYDSVSGDIDQLKLSYEWDWLKQYYDRKYK